jgi:hypothetical protein
VRRVVARAGHDQRAERGVEHQHRERDEREVDPELPP